MTKIPKVTVVSFACLGSMLLLASCASPSSGGSGNGGSNGSGTGGANASGGSSSSGGSNASGGNTGAAGSASGGNRGSGGVTATGGNTASGGNTGGSNASGGHGGSNPTGGSPGAGGTSAGGSGAGGTSATGGSTGTDQGGVALAKACDTISTSKGYLNLGDMRLLNNRWGSDAQNCNTTMTVSVACDMSLGWTFNRGGCDSSHAHPDFPEIEFGVAPFGTQSALLTSPKFSSTTLLPIQLSSLNSASVTITGFNSTYTNKPAGYFDTNFEFWISDQNPLTTPNTTVYAEIIMFFGWEDGRESNNKNSAGVAGWSCDASGNVTAGDFSFKLCHQKDNWSSGNWRFFNFDLTSEQDNVTGKGDVKAVLDWVMSHYSGFSKTMWLTRIEVGTEVDDNTVGQAKLQNVAFEINGTTKTPQLAK